MDKKEEEKKEGEEEKKEEITHRGKVKIKKTNKKDENVQTNFNDINKKIDIVVNINKDNNNNKKENSNDNKDKNIDINNNINDINNNINDINNNINNNTINKENPVIENQKDESPKKEIQKENKENYDKIFNKKLKNLEKLSQKMDFVLDKIDLSKKRIKDNINNKEEKPKDKILLEKELQLKNSLSMILSLTKENKKLREERDNLNKKLLNSDNLSLLEQISSKNIEIEKLKKKIIDLTKKCDLERAKNSTYETIISQSKEIINRYKIKNIELKAKNDSPIKKEIKTGEINKNNSTRNAKKNKLLMKSASDLNFKSKFNIKRIEFKSTHDLLHSNFHQLLTDKEKESLKKLFPSNDEFVLFMNKLYILETRNKIAENQLENEIQSLNKIVNTKENKINELNLQLEKRDRKINTLEFKLSEYKKKNQIINNKQRKYLTIEEQLKESGFKIKSTSNKEKIEKLNILVNHYREELNKNYIEKCKEEEINAFNKELGNIQFFDSKFFKNIGKKDEIN